MCGIAGAFGFDDERSLRLALNALSHRGPDGEGIVVRPRAMLGHRRLAVVDLSTAANQPMWSADGTAAIVFNGEIYDHDALRKSLGEERFRTTSDTEVLLEAYVRFGIEETLKRVRGMYAFAILDTKRGELHLARDPFGKKPLFVAHTARGTAFASTVPALLALLGTVPPVRPEAVIDLLTLTYVAGPGTFFEGIEALPPGSRMAIDARGQRSQHETFRPVLGPFTAIDEDDLVDLADERLRDAVRRRLVADVPVGAFLSGGIDSSLVVAAMCAEGGVTRTLTMGFRDQARDERDAARAVAEHFGTRHTELELEAPTLRELPSLVHHMGQPIADHAVLPTWLLARAARREVTVVLTGDGGDETFGGYEHYRALLVRDAVRAAGGDAALALGRGLRRLPGTFGRRAGRIFPERGAAPHAIDDVGVRAFRKSLRQLAIGELAKAMASHDPDGPHRRAYARAGHASSADRAMETDLCTQMPDDFLVKLDVATMGHGLEARSPFLDTDLFAFTRKVSATQKLAGFETKAILRRLARRKLPDHIVRRPKQGFSPDTDSLFRTPEAVSILRSTLQGPSQLTRSWLSVPLLREMADAHVSGRANHGQRLFAWLVLDVYARLILDGSLQPTDDLRGLADRSR